MYILIYIYACTRMSHAFLNYTRTCIRIRMRRSPPSIPASAPALPPALQDLAPAPPRTSTPRTVLRGIHLLPDIVFPSSIAAVMTRARALCMPRVDLTQTQDTNKLPLSISQRAITNPTRPASRPCCSSARSQVSISRITSLALSFRLCHSPSTLLGANSTATRSPALFQKIMPSAKTATSTAVSEGAMAIRSISPSLNAMPGVSYMTHSLPYKSVCLLYRMVGLTRAMCILVIVVFYAPQLACRPLLISDAALPQ